jgi:hypothetical protein
MDSHAVGLESPTMYPVQVRVAPALGDRNRLTTAFRLILALPHLILVGGPIAAVISWGGTSEPGASHGWSAGGGVFGAVAVVVAVIAWFAILVTGRYPEGLWNLAAFYLRWRVRVSAYVTLLRDEYPPFGDGPYPLELELPQPVGERDRLTVAFRLVLAIPHLLAIWALGIAWAVVTVIAWVAILFTGRHPRPLHDFATGALRWTTRVEAYLLLLRDEYPPFTFAP